MKVEIYLKEYSLSLFLYTTPLELWFSIPGPTQGGKSFVALYNIAWDTVDLFYPWAGGGGAHDASVTVL